MRTRQLGSLLPASDHVGPDRGAEALAAVAYRAVPKDDRWHTWEPRDPAHAEIAGWSVEQRRAAALRVHDDAVRSATPTQRYGWALDIVDQGVPWSRADLVWTLHRLADERGLNDGEAFRLPARIAASLSGEQLDNLAPVLEILVDELLDQRMWNPVRRDLIELFGAAIDRATGDVLPARLLHSGDAFGPAARRSLAGVLRGAGVRDALVHAAALTKPVPPGRWTETAASLAAPEAVRGLLELFAADPSYLHSDTDGLLRGLAYLLAFDPSGAATDLLVGVARAAAATPPRETGYPFAPKTATAAVLILADRDGDVPARALAQLSLTVRNKTLLTRIRWALDRLGALRGWEPGVAQELAVDDNGLDADGQCRWPHEDYTVVLEVGPDKPRLRYERDGAPVRVVRAPAPAKERLKRLTATFATERARVEALLAEERVWSLADWTDRYLRHPVTAVFARRLIWETSTDGTRWTATLPELDPEAAAGGSVRLWHPLDADAATVAEWRDRITAAGLRQPFKQAFRETYRITPAEVDAVGASSRFAGHILRYRQANALMRTRGWEASYLGTWGDGDESEATKLLGAGNWRASFLHELAGAVEPPHYDVEHCVTGTVLFVRRDGAVWAPAPLTDVPPRAFSEAMRDVDLFVGVTSIGTDDAWVERTDHRYYSYWADAGFGALTSRAEVRRDVLRRILPKLRIAGQCELGDRFLRVAGKLRGYRIHLGSGNILMEPNAAYLCIVPTRATAKIALPFDDDLVLSVILSKAMLLAADDKITDPAIQRQIDRLPAVESPST
jgi:hypothetical protein